MEAISTDVYWSPFDKVYHTHEDCSSLNQTGTLTVGTVEQAIAENRTRLCSFCARQDEITGVVTDDQELNDEYIDEEVEDEVLEDEVEEELEDEVLEDEEVEEENVEDEEADADAETE